MIEYLQESQLEEYQAKGLVADSKIVRLALMDKVKEGMLTLKQAQEQLKHLQKQAHGNGLYVREDFYKKVGVDLEMAVEKKRLKDLKALNKKLDSMLIRKKLNKNKNKL